MADDLSDIIDKGAVLLRNKSCNAYLVRSFSNNPERNCVGCSNKLINHSPLVFGLNAGIFSIGMDFNFNYTPEHAKWKLVPHEDGTYEIVHYIYNEPLYAVHHSIYHDDPERRMVFSWKGGPSIDEGFWRFEKCSNGCYKIMNTIINEYLYVRTNPLTYFIYTSNSKDSDSNAFYWEVLEDIFK